MENESQLISIIKEHMEKYEYPEALDLIEGLSDESKDNTEIMNYIAIISIELSEYKLAKEYLEKIISRDPQNNDYQYNYAYVCIKLGEYEEAKGILKKCRVNYTDNEMLNSIDELLLTIDEEEKKYKNVLMVAYFYPPLSGSGVFRSLKFTQYLGEAFWRPTVIGASEPPTGWEFRDDELMEQIPGDVVVHRIEDKMAKGKKQSISGEDINRVIDFFSKDIFRYDKKACDIIGKILEEKDYSTLLQVPCGQLWWALEVIQYIENNMDITKYQVIYTTSGPASAHLIGLYFKNKYNVNWVADFRDLWMGNPYRDTSEDDTLHMRLISYMEKVITERADKVINISKEAMEEQREMYGYDVQRAAVITNGYDENDFKNLTYRTAKNDRFTIVYSGISYGRERSLEPIVKGLRLLLDTGKISSQDILLQIVGNITQECSVLLSKYGLEECAVFNDYVEYNRANQATIDADLLLCLIGDEDRYKGVYTGKIFNYLRSGVPILALAPKEGAVDKMLMETEQGKTYLSTDIKGIAGYIEQLYDQWKLSDEKKYFVNEIINKYDRRYLTEQLAQVFEEAVKFQDEETTGEVYDALYSQGGVNGNYNEDYKKSMYYGVWLEAVKYLALLDRDTKIIDIGCGVGQFAAMLFDYGFQEYKGLDFSKEAIKIAQKTHLLQQEKFSVGDAFKDSIFDEEYDVVIMFEILEHLLKDLELLERVKPGKKVLLSVPNFADPNHVRYFTNIENVKKRYSSELDIVAVSEKTINANFKIFIVAGIKK